jgi:tellurite resistance-related uncharacterized protein
MTPYKVTQVFDEASLPQGLRRVHSTKEAVWGVIRILEGKLRLYFPETGSKRSSRKRSRAWWRRASLTWWSRSRRSG